MQRLAFYSLAELRSLATLHALDFEQSTGYLQLFRSQQDVEASATTRSMLTELGIRHTLLDAAQCRAIESALHPATPLAGGLHLPDDETGNCAFFAHQLKDIAIRDGVEFRFGVEARGFESAPGRDCQHRDLRRIRSGDAS